MRTFGSIKSSSAVGLLLLIIGLVSGLILIRTPQELREKAFTPEDIATMQNYWDGKAEFKLRNSLTLATPGWEVYGYGGGAHIEVVDGVWYAFGNKVHWGQYCNPPKDNLLKTGIEVRTSYDKGLTWSAPYEIVTPQAGTEWDCMAGDGDVYYHQGTNTWHHLFQCLKSDGIWNLCYKRRISSSPAGGYTAPYTNPVVQSGDLWHPICNSSSDHCVQIPGGTHRVIDEGTPNIFHFDGSHYYISFHGAYYGQTVHGFHGIAKTSNFSRGSWIAGNTSQGVPSDAIFDEYDANSWRENWQGVNIGGGAGTIIKEGSYYYMVVEAADMSLGCTDGQNWDQGVYRTTDLTSRSWNPYPFGNPIIYSSKWAEAGRGDKPPACNPAYLNFFRDDETGKIYMHSSIVSEFNDLNGIFIYELKYTENYLQNANLWKCSAENWDRYSFGGQNTNMTFYRYPHLSSDATCFMAVNCGSLAPDYKCVAGQSIYQDADLTGRSTNAFVYGGKFATWPGNGPGLVALVLFEYDSSGNVIRQTNNSISIGTSYSLEYQSIDLLSNTQRARYQIYLERDYPQTFRFDELFLMPEEYFLASIPPTPAPTNTPTPTRTPTPTPSRIPTPTRTPTPTSTNTPTPTNTPLPTATNTPVPTATNIPLPAATNTPIPTPTVEACIPTNGDGDGDGQVNGNDFTRWLRNFDPQNPVSGGPSSGDFNCDGYVNGNDFTIWLRNFSV